MTRVDLSPETPLKARIDHVRWTIWVRWADGSEDFRVFNDRPSFEAAYIELVGHPPNAPIEDWPA